MKVVFRLQFHATHIPQTGWDKLFVSFIPTDSGKATAKTTKANVRNGTCKWADPIYETTRLLQDAKNKQFDEKLYKLVVAMGSSRASVLGEAVINLADYADALKPSVVALPLHGCSSGTTLHVTVQLLTSKTGFREFEQQRELRDRGLQTSDKHDGHSPGKAANLEEIPADQMDKVGARLRSTSDVRELSLVEEETGNEEYADSSIGFEGSSNTSESLYTEKLDPSSANEIQSRKDKVSGDMNGDPNCLSSRILKGDSSDSRVMAHGSSDSVHGWGSDYSLDNDLAIANVENNRLRGNLELAESSIFELKLEVSSLQSQADEIRLETQNFSRTLASEIYSCEEMAKEVSLLKAECSRCKEEIGRLQNLKMSPQIVSRECGHVELYHLLQDTKLRWANGILVVENGIRELQSKIYLGFHERDSRFLHSELEALLNTLQDLKHGTEEATLSLAMLSSERPDVKDIKDMSLHKSQKFASGTGLDVEVCEPEIMLHHFSIPPLVSQEPDSTSEMDALKKNLFDLVRELDEAKVERESLVRKMGQMECYYEALIQELEENQKQMLGELQNLRNEHSTCLYKISTNKVEMEALRQDMNKQVLQLAEERRDMDVVNKELERRAATSEAALRRARLNYSIAVDRLQKDLELLSSQVLSMFETNESLIKQAFSETSQPQVQGSENIMQNFDATALLQSQNQNLVVRKQLGGDILLEDMKKSLCLQEELYQKVEEELSEMHSVNLHLDIFSKTLQETLCEANSDFRLIISKFNELGEQLRLSKESKDLLTERLQAAVDEVHNLREYTATCTAQYNDVALQNQILEARLESVSKENSLLVEKVSDCEAIIAECRSYQSQYEACLDEKTKLSGLLAQEVSLTSRLQTEMSILNEEMLMLKGKISLQENLEETISSVGENLGNLLASYKKHFTGLSLLTDLHPLDSNTKDCKDVILQLEEIQQNSCSKILQLIEEKKNLENERSAAVMSLSNIKSEFLATKNKFKNEMHDVVAKANASNVIVENLQLKLESVANKLLHSSEVEEKHLVKYGELLADFSIFELELQKLLSRDGQLVQEISSLDALYLELERSKLTISELFHEQQDLLKSVQSKTVEAANLTSEFSCLKENLRSLQDELDAERGVKDQLESAVGELTSQLNIEQNKVHDFAALLQDLQRDKVTISELIQEKQDILQSLQDKTAESAKLASEVSCLRENLMHLQDEFATERCTKDKLEIALEDLTSQLNIQDSKLHEFASLAGELDTSKLRISELIQEKQELVKFLEDKTTESAKLASEVGCLKEKLMTLQDELDGERGNKDKLECAVGDLTAQLNFERNKLHDYAALSEEIERSKMIISELVQEKQDNLNSLQDQTTESYKLASEINILKEILSRLENELHAERCTKDRLECAVGDLTSQLNIEQNKLHNFTLQKAELLHLRQLVTDFELEKGRLCELLLLRDKFVDKLQAEISSLTNLEDQLSEMHEYMVTADVKNVFLISMYETRIQELEHKLQSSYACFGELQKENHDVESLLKRSLANESHYAEENAKLTQNIELLRCKLEVSLAENRDLSEVNSIISVEHNECKKKLAILEARISEDKEHQDFAAEKLKKNLAIAEQEIISLVLSNEQLEIMIVVLKGKLEEQHAYRTLLKESEDELTTLHAQCTELSNKLSEQIFRTEEFKKLSIHLKELKDKADAECLAREKRESEGTPVAMQESLRIAFIKEQYETKLQELKQQLSISKKHGEEMLLKLQDAVDEIENRKRSEALHSKRNEELALKLLALEDELQSVLADNREKIKAYDRMKAELECAILSLECCKEEKEKLEIALRGCEEGKSAVVSELSSMKKQLEDVASSIASCNEESVEKDQVHHLPDNILHGEKVQSSSPVVIYEDGVSNASKEAHVFQDSAACKNVHGITVEGAIGGYLQETSGDHSQYSFKSESLKSSIKTLQDELERMKNENSLVPDDHYFDSDCEVLQNELTCLEKANEELRSIFPSYNEISSPGNALERVLALEIELAEALRAKHNSKSHFQSSFLKQHNSDEEAILKSFRDINELIKEMLELKGKYSTVEAELKEMHDRYSQLSLQFAEVEGDRQKLKMTLKNVRISKKLLQLNRPSSAANSELSS